MSWNRIGLGTQCACGEYKHVQSDGNGAVRERCPADCDRPTPAPARELTVEERRHERRKETRRAWARLVTPDRHCPCGCRELLPRTRGRPPKRAPTCRSRR